MVEVSVWLLDQQSLQRSEITIIHQSGNPWELRNVREFKETGIVREFQDALSTKAVGQVFNTGSLESLD